MRHHPEVLLGGDDLPPNFRLDYTPVAELLPSVDLLVTVSSTACLEALDQGCRVALVLDLGVSERHGNQVFLDSGLLRTWDEITADELGDPRPEWLHSYFFPRTRTAPQAVADRVEQLVASGERPGAAVRGTAYFRSAAAFHRAVTPRASGAAASRLHRLAWRDVAPPLLHRPVAAAGRQLRSAGARPPVLRSAG